MATSKEQFTRIEKSLKKIVSLRDKAEEDRDEQTELLERKIKEIKNDLSYYWIIKWFVYLQLIGAGLGLLVGLRRGTNNKP